MSNKNNLNEKKEGNEKKKKNAEQKYVKSVWRSVSIASIVLCVFLVGVILTSSSFGSSDATGMMTADSAAQKAMDFIKENMVQPGTEVVVNDVSEENGLYKIKIEVTQAGQSQEVESYMTKNGEIFFPQAVNITQVEEMMSETEQEEEETEEPEVEKVENPKANAFVMSYCPYGLQFMKAYVPVMELLGDVADLKLNFVNYAMHGKKELDENVRMYCIQEEQESKLTDYLRCFVENDDYEYCIGEAGVDEEMLETCVQQTDEEHNITGLYNDESTWASGRFPLFPVEDDLNQEYGVRGSPTFVLNGKSTSVSRSPESIKDAICASFIEKPEECEQELSTASEQPGIGPIGSTDGSTSAGSCG